MFRGEFTRGDGVRIPNNLTVFGIESLLHMALRGVDGTLVAAGGNFFVGLCGGVPDASLTPVSLAEPSLGVGGYQRVAVTRNTVGWPTSGNVNGEPFLTTGWLEWAASGVPFDQPIQRLFICASGLATLAPVIALSAPLPAPYVIGPSTPEAQRRFKYTLYAGR